PRATPRPARSLYPRTVTIRTGAPRVGAAGMETFSPRRESDGTSGTHLATIRCSGRRIDEAWYETCSASVSSLFALSEVSFLFAPPTGRTRGRRARAMRDPRRYAPPASKLRRLALGASRLRRRVTVQRAHGLRLGVESVSQSGGPRRVPTACSQHPMGGAA